MKDTYNDAPSGSAVQQENTEYNPVRADRAKQEQKGYGAMAIAASMAGGFHETAKEPRAVTYARMFCILFAMLVPSLLLIRVVL